MKSLKIENFRGIREGTLDDLADVNLIVGRNNSGKSTLAEALTRLALELAGQKRDQIWRGIDELWSKPRYESLPYPPDLWYKQERSKPILIEARMGETSVPGKLATRSITVQANGWDADVTPTRGQVEGGPDHNEVEQFFVRAMLFRPPDATDRNIESWLWPKMISQRRDKHLTRSLNYIFGLNAEGFQVLPENVPGRAPGAPQSQTRLVVLFPDFGVPLDAQGDGTKAALRCLMMLSILEGTMFVLEEPECHQHPGSLKRLGGAICRQAKEQSIQLLVSTQSAECVQAFLEGAKESGSDCAVLHLKLDNGLLTTTRLNLEASETLQATGVDLRSLDIYA